MYRLTIYLSRDVPASARANRALRLPDDARRYNAAAILRDLGVRSVRLLTENPAKLDALRRLGVRVEREPLVVWSHPLSLAYGFGAR